MSRRCSGDPDGLEAISLPDTNSISVSFSKSRYCYHRDAALSLSQLLPSDRFPLRPHAVKVAETKVVTKESAIKHGEATVLSRLGPVGRGRNLSWPRSRAAAAARAL